MKRPSAVLLPSKVVVFVFCPSTLTAKPVPEPEVADCAKSALSVPAFPCPLPLFVNVTAVTPPLPSTAVTITFAAVAPEPIVITSPTA